MKRLLILLLLFSTVADAQRGGFTAGQTSFPYVRKNLIQSNDFESGSTPWGFDNAVGADPEGVATIARVTDYASSGSYALRFIVNKSDDQVAGGRRGEVSNLALDTYPLERWVRIDHLIPSSWTYESVFSGNLYNIIQQFHDYGSGGETEFKSPFEFCISNNKFVYTHRDCITESNGDLNEYLKTPMTGNNPTVTKGQWFKIVIHVKFAKPPATGFVQIWINNFLEVNYSGLIGYNHAVAPYIKMGDYCWYYNDDNLSCCGDFATDVSKINYIDNVYYGNASANYNDVGP